MVKKNRGPIYIFILALVVLYVAIYIIPKVTGIFETSEILKSGTLQVTEEATCYFVRGETVYEADSAGSIKYLSDEGTHVRKDTKVIDFTEQETAAEEETEASSFSFFSKNDSKNPEDKSEYKDMISRLSDKVTRTTDCKAKSSGVLSYYIDGYESTFTPDNMDKLKYKDVEKLQIEAVDTTRKSTLEKEPLFKICDNDNWYMICWVEAASIAKYEKGNSVTIELPGGNVEATVKNITEEGDQWKITFRSNRYYKDFAKSRIEKATIVSKDYSGLIAKSSSVTTKDGKTGVMVRQTSGEYAFVRVSVIASDGEYSVLRDVSFIDEEGNSVNTVNVYDEILKNPGKGS